MNDNDRPSRETNLMQHAFLAAERSTCSRAHVGCVFARNGRILVTGYNGAPAGMPHCDHTCDCRGPGKYTHALSMRKDPRTGELHGETCKAWAPCTVSVHAEANAIAFAAKHGVYLDDSELFATYSPCVSCAQLLINVGITKLYAAAMYRVREGVELLQSAGIEVVDWGNSHAI